MATAPAPETHDIELERPVPYFLQLVQSFTWLPVHPPTVEKFDAFDDPTTRWTDPENFVCNGPFKLKTWKLNQVLAVEKSPTYWDRDKVRLNEIRFYPIESLTSENLAFRSGQLHATITIPLNKVDAARKANDPHLVIQPLFACYYYNINIARPGLDRSNVRRALALAIDRKKIVELITKGGETPAGGITPLGVPGYAAKSPLVFDPEEARALLAEAGYANGEGFPKYTLLYNTSESHRLIAQVVQQMWKTHLNIDVSLENKEWKVYLDAQANRDYDISRAGWKGIYLDPHAFLDLFVTGRPSNRTGWSRSDYDLMIEHS
ncbi:MAG: peptide ABC transporter substrate-binding protein, partial [Verrucomicrobiota bacterium]